MSPAARYLEAIGYEHTTTGGNCTAYTRHFSAGLYVLITKANDAEAPRTMKEPATAGLYAVESGAQLAIIDAPSVGALIMAINKGKWRPYDDSKIQARAEGGK